MHPPTPWPAVLRSPASRGLETGSLVSIWGPRREVSPRSPREAPLGGSSGALGLDERAYISSPTASQFLERPGRWTFPGETWQRPLLAPRGPAGAERRLCAQSGKPGDGSEAEAEFLAHAAAVALHYAAPVEAAQTVLLELHALLAVAAAAAQQVAATEVRGTAVAGAAARARRTGAPVGGAEVGRVGGV